MMRAPQRTPLRVAVLALLSFTLLCCNAFTGVHGACKLLEDTFTQPAGYFDTDGDIQVPEPPPGSLSIHVPSGSTAGTQAYGAQTCQWLITATEFDPEQHLPGFDNETALQNIFLSFYSFNLVPGDTLDIYDGNDASGERLAHFTEADELPEIVQTSQRVGVQMFIVFKSTQGTGASGHGFGAFWQAGGCLYGIALLSRETGWFTDGGGALTYASRLTCGWLVSSDDPSAHVEIVVQQEGLEDGFDFFYVYDGDSDSAPLIGRQTGDDPMNYTLASTSNSMYLVFQSDKTVCIDGFRVDYKLVAGEFCSGTTQLAEIAGRISDGSSAALYQPNTDCYWEIPPTAGSFVAIYFESFDLAEGDYVEITAGNELSTRLVGSVLPPPVIYQGLETVSIHFVSGGSQAEGFTFVYNAGGCLANVRTSVPTGTIADGSGDSDEYASNVDCLWLVQLDPELYDNILFDFPLFDGEYRFDILTVYDGTDPSVSPIIVQYSGYNQTFSSAATTGPSMLVRWITDADTSARGWNLEYTGQLIPPDDFVVADYDTAPGIVFTVLLMLTAVIILFLIIFFAIFGWKEKIMQHTNLFWNFFLLFMLFFCCFGLYPYLGEPTDGLCAWRPWTALLFIVTFMPLVIKMYTIWYFHFRLPKEEKGGLVSIRYSWKVMSLNFGILVFLVAIELIYLILWTAIDHPSPEYHDTNNSDEVYLRCESKDHAVWIAIQFSYIAVLLLVGLVAAIRVYVIRILWNEAKLLSLCVVLVILITIISVAVLYVVWDIPLAWISIMGFCLWFQIWVVLGFIFLPKAFKIVKGFFRKSSEAIDADWQGQDKKETEVADSHQAGDELDDL